MAEDAVITGQITLSLRMAHSLTHPDQVRGLPRGCHRQGTYP